MHKWMFILRFHFLCKSVLTYVSRVTVGWSTLFLLVTGTCRSWCWDNWRHVCHSLWENKSSSPSHEEQNVTGILSLIRNVGLHRCIYSQCTQVLNLQIQGRGFWQVLQSRALGRSLWLSWALENLKLGATISIVVLISMLSSSMYMYYSLGGSTHMVELYCLSSTDWAVFSSTA